MTKEAAHELVWDELLNNYQETEKSHVQGFVLTQSLKKVLEYVPAGDIIALDARAQSKDAEESFKTSQVDGIPGLSAREELVSKMDLRFRKLKHDTIRSGAILSELESSNPIDEMAISRMVVQVDEPELADIIRDIMVSAFGLQDSGYMKPPFFCHLVSEPPATEKERRMVESYNDDQFLTQTKAVRVMRLNSLYSLRAQMKSQNRVHGNHTPQKLEDECVNYFKGARYGILYSHLFNNKWRGSLGNQIAHRTRYELDESNEWVAVETEQSEQIGAD
jgi:hypothetical protein